MNIEILFEDEDLLLVNKAAGLFVHKGEDSLRPDLQSLLEKKYNQKLVLFHRLDAETSGIVILGKNPRINSFMHKVFEDRKIEKIYWAMVEGEWNSSDAEVETYICKDRGRYINKRWGEETEKALSIFKVLASNLGKSWLEVNLMTGRTHQIRLHAQFKGHPVLGDGLYGQRDSQGVPMALHARSVRFPHPITQKELCIKAPLPESWFMKWLQGLTYNKAILES